MMFLVFALLAAPPPPMGEDPIGSRLYPPELIMQHQQELGIDDKQHAVIVKEVEKVQSQTLQMQWQLQSLVEALSKLLEAAQVDEAKALAQAEKVMNLERDIKKAHLGMLIRIKNVLTEAQRAKLAALRKGG